MEIARTEGYLPISGYALIGNCHTAALVGIDGSIDFACPGQFDAPAIFCRVLDARRGGSFSIAPAGQFTAERRYRDGTAILETTFQADGFTARITDFMPIGGSDPGAQGKDVDTSHELIRLVEGIQGEGELDLRFHPTFGFAGETTETEVRGSAAVAGRGEGQVRLDTAGLELRRDADGAVTGRIPLRQGDRRWLVVSHGLQHDALRGERCDTLLRDTQQYWERWSSRCSYVGPYREQVLRSAITLKLLTYEPTGAVVAAPTTSLPEWIGGPRNWDYRYTWLRDSALILYALMSVGYEGEAADFMQWLHRTLGDDPTGAPQIMYTIDGGRKIEERELKHLSGYRDSSPVRIGNGAATQTQLDIYGEVMVAADIHFCAGDTDADALRAMWPTLRWIANGAAERWREQDEGIWEVRGGPRDFLYSKLLCWAALDRALDLATTHHLPAPLDRWRAERDAIRRAILEQGYDEKMHAFTQSFGSDVLDSSVLLIPRLGFLPATDQRVQGTIEAVRKNLTRNGLVYRYLTPDGLTGGEGTFTLCTYWLVDALALSGKLDEAHAMFERLLGYANDVGLMSEEIDPRDGAMLGNFPQGFSHLSMIQSAVNLATAEAHGAEDSPHSMAGRVRRGRGAASVGHGGPAAGQ